MNSRISVVISAEIRDLFHSAGYREFTEFMGLSGGRHICHKRGRSVFRFEIGPRAFYLKRNRFHRIEFFKRLLKLQFPQREAVKEWRNIQAVRNAGIPTITPVAMGEKSLCGFETASFIISEELYGAEPLDRLLQRRLGQMEGQSRKEIKQKYLLGVVDIARKLHHSGMNHQDFYLSHFYADDDDGLYLIDLQRVMCRSQVPMRFLIKDLGQLNYSAEMTGVLTRSDRMRFLHLYLGVSSLESLDKILARKIMAKTMRIAKHTVKLLERRRRRGEIV